VGLCRTATKLSDCQECKVVSWLSEHEGLHLRVGYDRWPASAKREEYEHRSISFTIGDDEKRAVATGTFVEWEFNYPSEDWVEDNSRAGVPRMSCFLIALTH